jgi:hypothetical protein
LNLLIMVNVAVVIEVIFNWPGVGQLLYDALSNRDFPMVQGVVLMSGLMIVVLNFTIDVLYGYVDPRPAIGLTGGRDGDDRRRPHTSPSPGRPRRHTPAPRLPSSL